MTNKNLKNNFNIKIIAILFTILFITSAMVPIIGAIGNVTNGNETDGNVTNGNETISEEHPKTVIDVNGNEITIHRPIERIIVLSTRHAEAIRMLGAENKVVGVTDTIHTRFALFPEFQNVPSVGRLFEPNIEKIMRLEPCIILTLGRFPNQEVLEDKLVGTNIIVLRLDIHKGTELIDSIELLGGILGKENRANEYITWHNQIVNSIKSRVAEIPLENRPRVFMDSTLGGGRNFGRRGITPASSFSDHLTIAGGINILEGHVDTPRTATDIELEFIITQNPDLIIARQMRRTAKHGYEADCYALLNEFHTEIINLPGFYNVSAIKNNRVYIMSSSITGGPLGSPVTIAHMAQWLHPEIFADLNPQSIHQDYLNRFTNTNFCVTSRGVFVYPLIQIIAGSSVGTYTESTSTIISGVLRGTNPKSLTINNEILSIGLDNTFSKKLPLNIGSNVFTVEVTDVQGRSWTRRITVLRSGDPGVAPPEIEIECEKDEGIQISEDIIEFKVSETIYKIDADESKEIEIKETYITEIIIDVAENTQEIELNVKQLMERPKFINNSIEGVVNRYFKITVDMLPEKIENVTINFKVENSWINENNISAELINLIRFNKTNESWDILTTNLTSTDKEYTHYSAITPELSIFAIMGNEKVELLSVVEEELIAESELEPIVEEVEKSIEQLPIMEQPAKQQTEPPETPGFGMVVALFGLIVAITMVFKKK